MKKLTLLALSAMFSFAGLAQAAESCATSKCKTACSTKAKTECATKEKCATKCSTKEKCATKCAEKKACATKCATKEVCESKCATKKECATKCADKCVKKKKCATSKCATKCDATTKVAHFNVAGMTCTGCSSKLTKSLNALEGVTVKKVCHKSGCVDVVLGEKATPCQVKKAITANGLKVVAPKKG